MSKYSWNDYAGTSDPHPLFITATKRGETALHAYGFKPGLVRQLTEDEALVEVFEFGKSNGFYLVVEAKTSDQAGYLLRKFLKDAVLHYIGLSDEQQPKLELLDLGTDEWNSIKQ